MQEQGEATQTQYIPRYWHHFQEVDKQGEHTAWAHTNPRIHAPNRSHVNQSQHVWVVSVCVVGRVTHRKAELKNEKRKEESLDIRQLYLVSTKQTWSECKTRLESVQRQISKSKTCFGATSLFYVHSGHIYTSHWNGFSVSGYVTWTMITYAGICIYTWTAVGSCKTDLTCPLLPTLFFTFLYKTFKSFVFHCEQI